MKEMKYGSKRKIEVLDTGKCCGYIYYILNLGTHPTAYINIPEDHRYYGRTYEGIGLLVHGGVTYSKDHLWISEKERKKGWFIGWDYAHYGDYTGYQELLPEEFKTTDDKKWTTEEIRKEVLEACLMLERIKYEC
jgi:hypothetical protein